MNLTSSRKGDCREKVQSQCIKSVQGGGQICLVGTALAATLIFGGCSGTTETNSTGSGEQPTETTEAQPQTDNTGINTSAETTEAPEQKTAGGINFDDYPYDDNLPLPEEYQDDDIEISQEQYAKNIALSIDDITEDLNINKLSDVDEVFLRRYLAEKMSDEGYTTSSAYIRSSDGKTVIPGTGNGCDICLAVNNDNEFAIFTSTSNSQDGYLYRSQYIPTPDQLAIIYSQNAGNFNASSQEVCEY